MNQFNGKLIVLDGIDGSGKATQAALLLERLQQEGYDAVKIDFPQYGQKSAGLVENYLNGKYGQPDEVNPFVTSFFYALDRYDASFKMKEWLSQGKIIIADRYVSANAGHQGGKILDKEKRLAYYKWLEHYEYEVFNIPRPDLTVFLHLPPQQAQELIDQKVTRQYLPGTVKRDGHEADLAHLRRANEAYEEMAALFPNFVKIECIDSGLLTIEQIGDRVWSSVSDLLKS